MDSASAASYKLQLAVAALVGASAAAASAYYLHCRAVAQLGGDIVRSSAAAKSGRQRRRQRDAESKPPPPRRAAPGSSSLPDLSSIYAAGGVARGYPVGEEYDYDDDDEEGVGPYGDDALAAAAACMQIPKGLPRLQVGPEEHWQYAIER